MSNPVKDVLYKRASAYQDAVTPIPASLLMGAIPGGRIADRIIDLGGSIHGIAADLPRGKKAQLAALADMKEDVSRGLIPGVASSRFMRRQRLLHALLAQNAGGQPNMALHTKLSRLNPLNIIASPFAGLAAALTSSHSPKDRSEFVNDPNKVLKTWLIPGYGTYNYWKDLGLSNRLEDIKGTIAELRAEGKDAEAAEYAKLLKRR